MDVRIGEHDPVAARLFKARDQRVRFSQPTRRQVGDIDDIQISTRALEFVKDGGSLVRGAVIDGDDFKTGIILRQQRCERGGKFFRFIARGKNNGNRAARPAEAIGVTSESHGRRAMPMPARMP